MVDKESIGVKVWDKCFEESLMDRPRWMCNGRIINQTKASNSVGLTLHSRITIACWGRVAGHVVKFARTTSALASLCGRSKAILMSPNNMHSYRSTSLTRTYHFGAVFIACLNVSAVGSPPLCNHAARLRLNQRRRTTRIIL